MTEEQLRLEADEAMVRAGKYIERLVKEMERDGYTKESFLSAAYRLAERVDRARSMDRRAFLIVMATGALGRAMRARIAERTGF